MSTVSLIDRASPAVVTNGAPPRSRLPAHLRAPIYLVLVLTIRGTLLQATADLLGPELGFVSKSVEDFGLALARLVITIAQLYSVWWGNYDFIDIAALSVLTNVPYYYMCKTYYNISTNTIATIANVEVFALAAPAYLLRPRSAVHNKSVPLRERFLLNSFQVQWSTAALAMGVYVTVLWVGIKTGWLNSFLVTHFDLPTLEESHNETPVSLLWKTFMAGIAAREFLLNPSIGAYAGSGTLTPVEPFDPATATLPATLKKNFWNFNRRTRTLIRQTAVLSFHLSANAILKTITLEGSDLAGAVGYTGWWIGATWIIAAWWSWVGQTEA